MKVKIFTNYFANELEDAINRFLNANPKIKITHIVQSESKGVLQCNEKNKFRFIETAKNITTSIFYTE